MDNDLTKCPRCGGYADNGFDRCLPPSPYNCSKCVRDDEIKELAALAEEKGFALVPLKLTEDIEEKLNKAIWNMVEVHPMEVTEAFYDELMKCGRVKP